jgi:hypothetical protein
MTDDLVLQHPFDLDFAQPNPVQLLLAQVQTCRRLVRCTFSPAQQIPNRSRIDLIRLFSLHHLLIPVLFLGIRIQQSDGMTTLDQMAGQVLEIVAGRFHADPNGLSTRSHLGCINFLAQVPKTTLEYVLLKHWRDNLSQTVVDHGNVKILAYVQGDAQEPIQRNALYSLGKRLAAFTP